MQAVGWEMECHQGTSAKFYRIIVADAVAVFEYGPIGRSQSICAQRHDHPFAAQDAAWRQSRAKLRKYQTTVPEMTLDVERSWLDDVYLGSAGAYALQRAFRAASSQRTDLRGTVPFGSAPRLVALRSWKTARPVLIDAGSADVAALVDTAPVVHKGLDVRLVALPAVAVCALDLRYTPRLGLTDLGPAVAGESPEVWMTALTLFEAGGSVVSSSLTAALEAARLVHT